MKDKVLLIKIKKKIIDAVTEYCVLADIDLIQVGLQYGVVHARGNKETDALNYLNQLFFFAGVHHASNNKEINISYVKPEKMKKIIETTKKEMLKKLENFKSTMPNYVG